MQHRITSPAFNRLAASFLGLASATANPALAKDPILFFTNSEVSAGEVTYTRAVGTVAPEELAAYEAAGGSNSLSGRVFWLNLSSTITTNSNGTRTVKDMSGQGNNGVIANAAQAPTAVTVNSVRALQFDGNDDLITVPNVSSATFGVFKPYTWIATVCMPNPVPADATQGSGASYNALATMGGNYYDSANHGLISIMQDAANPTHVFDMSGGSFGSITKYAQVDASWCTVMLGRMKFGYDKSGNVINRYAKFIDQHEVKSNGSGDPAVVGTSRVKGDALVIGNDPYYLGRGFIGQVVEFQLFDRALTNQQIALETAEAGSRVGVKPVFIAATLIDPTSRDISMIPAEDINDCLHQADCFYYRPTSTQTSLSLMQASCSAISPGSMTSQFERCAGPFPIPAEASGVALNFYAFNFGYETWGDRNSTKRYSAWSNPAPRAATPAVP